MDSAVLAQRSRSISRMKAAIAVATLSVSGIPSLSFAGLFGQSVKCARIWRAVNLAPHRHPQGIVTPGLPGIYINRHINGNCSRRTA